MIGRDRPASRRGLVIGLIFVVLALPLMVPGDRIVLNTGQVVEGKIVSRTAGEIMIVTPSGIESRFLPDRVAEVIEIPDDQIGPGESLARQAIMHHRAGRHLESWNSLIRMMAAEEQAASRHAWLVRRTITEVVGAMDRAQQAGNSQLVLELADSLDRGEGRLLVLASVGDTTSMEARLRLARGRAHLQLGRALRESGEWERADQEIAAALETLTAGDADYPFALLEQGRLLQLRGDAVAREGLHEEAMQFYRQSRRVLEESIARANTAEGMTSAREGLQRVREQEARLARIMEALAPPPAPPMIRFRPMEEVAEEENDPGEEGLVASLLGERITAFLRGHLEKILPEQVSSDDVIEWLGYGLAFVLVFWIIPAATLNLLLKRGDHAAARAREKVLFLGPMALLVYLVSFVHLPGKGGTGKVAQHFCPHCGFAMDDVLVFANLDFDHCPNCGGGIEAFRNEEDYIRACAEALSGETEKVSSGLVSLQAFAAKDLMQKLVRAMVTKAVRSRASDIHIQPQDKQVDIRHRIDGVMIPMLGIPSSLGPGVVSAVKVMASLDISEKRKPQDGAMSVRVDDADIDIRVATSPSNKGETASLRLLDFRALQTDSKKLGMSRSTREVFERVIHEPHGLVLVCGPTGSGKTTTLYVALRTLVTGERNIISVEDPVEFRLPGVNQIQVNPAAGLTFANALRSILRQDPDVVMIGEIRDRDTAEIAINASQTGHLVFSSLHTIDAASSVTRLLDFGISERQFSMALSLVMAQRLVRLVCPDCKKPVEPNPQVLRDIGIQAHQEAEYEFLKGKGCETCSKTGYLGRTGVFELLVPNNIIRSALERGNLSTVELRELAIENGMRTLREEALIMLRQGLTTPEEVLRVTK